MTRLFDIAIWLGAAAHFCLLLVSVQVPGALGWRADLAKLRPFNRKVFWVFGGYVVFTYLAFGVLTVVLHDELLRGDRAAVALAVFIGLYWLVRLGVDAFWFSAADWPRGVRYRVGHVMLNLTFCALTVTYLGLAIWHTVT